MTYPATDFGVRDDARNGRASVQSEDGVGEPYDLHVDPWRLNNAVDNLFDAPALDRHMCALAGVS